MGTLKDQVLELWNNVLLTYRTMVIKAELKRRKAVKNSQDRSNDPGKKSNQLNDHNPRDCHKHGQTSTVVDNVHCPTAFSTSTGKTHNCDCRSEMTRVFDLFDANKDGLISGEELKLYMKRLGFELSDQNVEDMLATVDSNRDDHLDFEEFFSLYCSLCGEGRGSTSAHDSSHARDNEDEEEADLLKAFFNFDRNRDGSISALELQQVLLDLGVAEGKSLMRCQKMIERIDADGNGKVDFFEFKDMMRSNTFSFCNHTIDSSCSSPTEDAKISKCTTRKNMES